MKILFWFSLITIIYVYLLYPVLVYIMSFLYKKPLGGKYSYPYLSILLAAHNEEKNMERKIKSLLEIDYPQERFEILIGSDGSTDKTNEITTKLMNEKIKFFSQQKRQGKPGILNLLAEKANGEILVFTDARQRLDKNALKELVKHFSDQKIGSVSAELIYENEDHNNKTGSGVGLYWKYEKFIRKSEARMGSMLGATGALYAIRRELFPKLPQDLILDDIYIPMKIVERGFRAIMDPKAKVYDRVFLNPKGEFLRKTRTLAGNFQLVYYLGHLFNPLKGKISWQFFSHKFLRVVVSFLLILLFVSNILILGSTFYQVIFILQAAFYLMALLGFLFKRKIRIFDVPYMFCVMNSASLVGLYKLLSRKQNAIWQKAEVVSS